MIKIGITGGIGSGKSVVASLFTLRGVPVYLADEESKRLTNHSPHIREGLIQLFGPTIYIDENLNKPLLASHIFNDPDMRQRVNQIIHPEVKRDFLAWVERQTTPLCAIECAILFESGFNELVDHSLMVYAPLELRINRAIRRDKSTKEAIKRRMESQMPDEEKRDRSDFVIHNDDRKALIPQVDAFISDLLSLSLRL